MGIHSFKDVDIEEEFRGGWFQTIAFVIPDESTGMRKNYIDGATSLLREMLVDGEGFIV